MRSRTLGTPRPGVPEIVLVPGLAVADYLLPGLAAWGEWTRAHLLELPGQAGSGEPPYELSVAEYSRAVTGWLAAHRPDPVILAGHSSGTQVVAEAAAGAAEVAGLVLAGPMTDPAVRGRFPLAARWAVEGLTQPPALTATQATEWWRAGPRRLTHLVGIHRRHRIEDPLRRVTVPVLVLRGRRDRLCSAAWTRRLGRQVEMPGAHCFPWSHPHAWSEPVRQLAALVSR
ncbi:alpha/beta hydrolase [Actinoplanes sp. NPDC024001]|uniref:alpha/beta fold hydrolase n=1 Tax=Actinoplanes sp. NPDC024001 TaxID=3154598 RepID=UPI0033EE6E87